MGQFRLISRMRAINRTYLPQPASAERVIRTKGGPERFAHAPAFARDSDDFEFLPYGGGTAFLAGHSAYEHPPPSFYAPRDRATRSSDCTVVRTETQRESCGHSVTWGPKSSLFPTHFENEASKPGIPLSDLPRRACPSNAERSGTFPTRPAICAQIRRRSRFDFSRRVDLGRRARLRHPKMDLVRWPPQSHGLGRVFERCRRRTAGDAPHELRVG